MALSERWTANSVISQSIRMVSLPVNLNQVRWKSPNPGEVYTFKIDLTDTEGQRYVCTFTSKVTDME